jgi:hypothetical protein
MKVRRTAVVLGALAAIGLGACGERIEAGLANAPSIERKSEPRQQYDVVADGEEGCTNRDGGASIASAAGACRPMGIGGGPDAAAGPQGSRLIR